MPSYRRTSDYLLIVSHVCFDIFDQEECSIPEDAWSNKYDKRGDDFRKELIAEVHVAITGIVKQVKEARGDL